MTLLKAAATRGALTSGFLCIAMASILYYALCVAPDPANPVPFRTSWMVTTVVVLSVAGGLVLAVGRWAEGYIRARPGVWRCGVSVGLIAITAAVAMIGAEIQVSYLLANGELDDRTAAASETAIKRVRDAQLLRLCLTLSVPVMVATILRGLDRPKLEVAGMVFGASMLASTTWEEGLILPASLWGLGLVLALWLADLVERRAFPVDLPPAPGSND